MKNILAYTAGYIDGDGCLYIGSYETQKCTVYESSVQVCSTDKDVLTFMQNEYGGVVRKKERRTNHKQPWVWTIKNAECISLIEKIQPYLIAKHQESHYFLEFAYTIKNSNNQPLSKDQIEHREELIKMKRLICHTANVIQRNLITESWKNIEYIPEKTTSEDFSYLAGLIDAEGCFRVKYYKRANRPNTVFNTCLEIGNTNKLFFEWLLFKFGGSVYFCKSTRENRKHSATWIVQAKALNNILPNIVPFLKHKRRVADKLIEFYNTILPNGGDRHSAHFRKKYADTLLKREAIVKEIQKYNAKGHLDSKS